MAYIITKSKVDKYSYDYTECNYKTSVLIPIITTNVLATNKESDRIMIYAKASCNYISPCSHYSYNMDIVNISNKNIYATAFDLLHPNIKMDINSVFLNKKLVPYGDIVHGIFLGEILPGCSIHISYCVQALYYSYGNIMTRPYVVYYPDDRHFLNREFCKDANAVCVKIYSY